MFSKYFRWVSAELDSRAGHERSEAPPLEQRTAAAHLAGDFVCDDTWETMPPPMPAIDLPLAPREQAVFLLRAAAEIEHALMVQYLYAAYSVRIPRGAIPSGVTIRVQNERGQTETQTLGAGHLIKWRDVLLQIAREEMAHLITVQNLLRLIGGPLHFEREDSPYQSDIYPFRFKLERLSLGSLAKYVTAERPVDFSQLNEDDRKLVRRIDCEAFQANDKIRVIQVGGIFSDLRAIFAAKLSAEDFRTDTAEYQAEYGDWGYEPRRQSLHGEPLIVRTLRGPDLRVSAVEAIDAIAEQGEGFDGDTTGPESHFERFFSIYKEMESVLESLAEQNLDWRPTWPVATNPNTSGRRKPALKRVCPVSYAEENDQSIGRKSGRITNEQTRAWARLFNQRYRMLLNCLHHFLLIAGDRYEENGDRTPRGLLLLWTFDEMRRLKRLAGKLVSLPLGDPETDERAGPPFELPYMLNLPSREIDRWRLHSDVSKRGSELIRDELLSTELPDDDALYLRDLMQRDFAVQQAARAMAFGRPLPEPADRFQKVARILDEAVRGFDIGAHGNFWNCLTRDDFVEDEFGIAGRMLAVDPETGEPVFDPDQSPLIQRLRGVAAGNRMPRGRPPVPAARIQFIHDWIAAGCPDNEPPGQVGLRREGERCRSPKPDETPAEDGDADTGDNSETDPRPNRPTSFAMHIRPLMRDIDIQSMSPFFDLSKHADVKANSAKILKRLKGEGNRMPPDDFDGPWRDEWIRLFARWIDEGHPE